MSARDGGDAFPSPGVVLDMEYGDEGQTRQCQQGAYAGMSLRDYFAARTMPVLLAGLIEEDDWKIRAAELTEKAAQAAYIVADAMLRARQP